MGFYYFLSLEKESLRKKEDQRGKIGGAKKSVRIFVAHPLSPFGYPPFTQPRGAGQRRGAHFPLPGMSPRNRERSPIDGSSFSRFLLPGMSPKSKRKHPRAECYRPVLK